MCPETAERSCWKVHRNDERSVKRAILVCTHHQLHRTPRTPNPEAAHLDLLVELHIVSRPFQDCSQRAASAPRLALPDIGILHVQYWSCSHSSCSFSPSASAYANRMSVPSSRAALASSG